ncbi:MAG: hypothetical protein J6R18_01495, partial [Kiritimatiellae bacterium]|nr:hypothetical protein [Kiritimatiellia bacterium]
ALPLKLALLLTALLKFWSIVRFIDILGSLYVSYYTTNVKKLQRKTFFLLDYIKFLLRPVAERRRSLAKFGTKFGIIPAFHVESERRYARCPAHGGAETDKTP